MTCQRQGRVTDSASSLKVAALALTIVLVLTFIASPSAQAQTLNVIHNFENGADGRTPVAGLTVDTGGNLYGTAVNGGQGCGTVFQLKKLKGSGWLFNPLFSFGEPIGSEGCYPSARVIFGPNGTLFGTTQGGGAGNGVVFNLRPFPTACHSALCPWRETVIYNFAGPPDGANPEYGDLLFDQGNIYGTTYAGGLSNSDCGPFQTQTCGVVYQLTPKSGGGYTESVLYSFKGGSDGGNPYAGVVLDQAGNFYGTTYDAGSSNFGTVYQLTCGAGGCTDNVLHSFTNGGDGGSPIGGLIFDQLGNLYGVGSDGGTGGDGTVFELSPSGGGWTFTVLYNFTSPEGGQCGPRAGLSMDAAGNLYGTTYCDGAKGYGNVFELSPLNGGWTYKDLYDFKGGSDGKNPVSSVLLHPNGKLYGTTSGGGDLNCDNGYGCGVVWELTP